MAYKTVSARANVACTHALDSRKHIDFEPGLMLFFNVMVVNLLNKITIVEEVLNSKFIMTPMC